MNEFSWADAKRRAIRTFGDELPNAQTEDEILNAFREQPAAVMAAIDEVAEAKRRGQARSGWAVLRSRLARAAAVGDVVVTDASERERALRNAAAWTRNVGILFDRESEFRAEIEQQLRPFDEPEKVERLVAWWRGERPRGERAEAESLAYQEHARRQRIVLAAALAPKPQPELEGAPA